MTVMRPTPGAAPAVVGLPASVTPVPEQSGAALHPLLERQVKRVCKDGNVLSPGDRPETLRTLLARVSKAYSDNDRERYLLERGQEISSREMFALHEQLRASEARLANLVSLSSDWVWETDLRGRLTFVTAPSEHREFDLRPFVGRRILPARLPAVDGNDPKALREVLAAKSPFRNFVFGLPGSGDHPVYLRVSGEPFVRDGVVAGFRGVASDVTRAVLDAQAVNRLASYDELTGLPNRARFLEELGSRITHASGAPGEVSVMFVDLDRFKAVNDSLGHAAGDKLLRVIAGRLRHAVRERDMVARLGGDEFVVLLGNGGDERTLQMIAQRLLEQIERPVPLGDRPVHVSGSIGIASYPEDGDTADELVRNADTAMYLSKESGKATFRHFTPELAEKQRQEYVLEEELRRAIVENELRLVYQPILDAQDLTCSGVEALIRWQHPARGLLTPNHFLDIAEDTGLLVPIGRWVLRTACQQLATWRAEGLVVPSCAVNLSLKQFASPTLVEDVRSALADAGIDGASLEVEITESQMMADPEGVQAILLELRALGVRVAIDDFGTGYSSLAYLKRLSAHTLKVDRSFVRGLPDDKEDVAIMRAVLALGHSVGMEIVAEGVETEEQLAFLRHLECDRVQGYLLGRPLPPAALREAISRDRSALMPPAVADASCSQSAA